MIEHEKKFFYWLLGLSTVAMFFFLRKYIAVIMFSILLAVVFFPLYKKSLKLLFNNKPLALIVTFLVLVICVAVPLVLAGYIIGYSIKDASSQAGLISFTHNLSLSQIIDKINSLAANNLHLSLNLTTDMVAAKMKDYASWAASLFFGNLGNIASIVADILPLSFIFLYVMGAILINYQNISVYLHDLSPLRDEVDHLYVQKIKSMAISMVKGTFIVAIVQGLVTGLFFWVAGIPYAFFFSLLAIVLSIIPLGAGILAVPIGIILLLTGNIWQGLLILFVQFFITSNIDNILRPKLVDEKASLHPALTLLGLFAGIANFGFMGLIYGPVFMIFFVTTLDVYRNYYRASN